MHAILEYLIVFLRCTNFKTQIRDYFYPSVTLNRIINFRKIVSFAQIYVYLFRTICFIAYIFRTYYCTALVYIAVFFPFSKETTIPLTFFFYMDGNKLSFN